MATGVALRDNFDSYFKKHYGVDNEFSPTCGIIFGRFKSKIRTSINVFHLKAKPKEIYSQLLEDALKK